LDMTIQGVVQNGVVVLEGGAGIPDGTPVTVVVEQPQAASSRPQTDRMSDEEYRRVRAILDEIASLPNENPGDTFSGRDHDKVLYGEP
jgi:hypothetical protein